jgi:hypothetical protein
MLWHFNFRGPDVDRLVKGRERIYLDRFYNELSADPKKIDEATRNHYAKLYARPGNMHYAFEQFAAFSQDAKDNKVFAEKKLTCRSWRLAPRNRSAISRPRSCATSAPTSRAASSPVPDTGSWKNSRRRP